VSVTYMYPEVLRNLSDFPSISVFAKGWSRLCEAESEALRNGCWCACGSQSPNWAALNGPEDLGVLGSETGNRDRILGKNWKELEKMEASPAQYLAGLHRLG